MKKFLVVVNNVFVITVEAETMGGAEHKILDHCYYGIKQCQAFELDNCNLLFEMFPNVVTSTFDEIFKACKLEQAKQLLIESDKLKAKAHEIMSMFG